MTRVDCVIIGQGLAGTVLAWQLLRRGQRVLVVDREGSGSASRIAAGLVTPVTGKRLAKSWRWDEVFPAAVAFYREREAELGEVFFHQRPALRLFASDAERAEFLKRAAPSRERGTPSIAEFVRANPAVRDEHFDAPLGGFEMPAAARLDVPRFLDASRTHFRQRDTYRTAEIDLPGDVELLPDRVRIPKLVVEAGTCVLCRGFAHSADPWFGGVRFNAAKGETLTLRIPGLREERVIHRGIWLAPAAGGDLFRCGATYAWDDLNDTPTAAARDEIEAKLRAFLRRPFEVIDHRAAVRPVIDAGFPVLGRHPAFPALAYFNGLGSKGSLLAPFFAGQLADCLLGGREPDPEVNVRKFLGR